MRRKLLIAVVLLLSAATTSLRAQVSRSAWTFSPVLQTDNIIYTSGATCIVRTIPACFDDDEKLEKFIINNRWWIPEIRYRANVLQEIETAAGELDLRPKVYGFSGMDWSLDSYAAGYHVGCLPKLSPIGFDIEADYVQDGFRVKATDGRADGDGEAYGGRDGNAPRKARQFHLEEQPYTLSWRGLKLRFALSRCAHKRQGRREQRLHRGP